MKNQKVRNAVNNIITSEKFTIYVPSHLRASMTLFLRELSIHSTENFEIPSPSRLAKVMGMAHQTITHNLSYLRHRGLLPFKEYNGAHVFIPKTEEDKMRVDAARKAKEYFHGRELFDEDIELFLKTG